MKKVKCPKCNHEWETKSKLVLVTCPSCQLKVRIKKEARGDDLPYGTHNRNSDIKRNPATQEINNEKGETKQ